MKKFQNKMMFRDKNNNQINYKIPLMVILIYKTIDLMQRI